MRTLLLAACLWSSVASAGADAEVDPRHVAAIRAAAKDFGAWGRVDEVPNIAPFLCRAPRPADHGAPSHVRMSAAEQAPHGRKLYYLWASDKDRYLAADGDLPVGFSIVKESFAAVPFAAPPRAAGSSAANPRRLGVTHPAVSWMITPAGEKLMTGERKDLFVMTKVGQQPGTDAGWVYGTVAPDGTVTSAGRVARCMGCHTRSARHERLFGLPAAPRS